MKVKLETNIFLKGFDKEMVRQVIPESKWRVSFVNVAYSMCDTYPNKIIIPASISDGDLEDVFSYRSRGRIPVLTYYHFNGSVMARSSQPMTGLSGRTCLGNFLFSFFFFFFNVFFYSYSLFSSLPNIEHYL